MIKRIKIISLFVIASIIVIMPKSYAKIEIKPAPETNANKVMVWTTVSNSYLVCQQMKNKGENLYGTSVKPHLSTNKDWGAVSYLSNSMYGTNTRGQNTGVEITMNGVKYYSTNGNSSGVMNWGSNPYKDLYSQTAGIGKSYMDLADTSTSLAYSYVTEIEKAARNNSEYVEIFKANDFSGTKGMAMYEVNYSFSSHNSGTDKDNPISVRKGLFKSIVAYHIYAMGEGTTVARGTTYNKVTFRPVIWN